MFITSITRHVLQRHAMRALDILDSYWAGLAAQGELPLWSSIDPGRIQDALDHAFLAEMHGRSHARLRVAGTAVNEMAGRPCAGLPLGCLVDRDNQLRLQEALLLLVRTRRPVEVRTGAGPCDHLGRAEARLVLYPLRDTAGRVTQLLGAVAPVMAETSGAGPFRISEILRHPAPIPRARLTLVVNNP